MSKIVYKSTLPFPFAKAVRAGDFVFVSGQLPFGPDGNMIQGTIEVQTRVVLETIAATLEEAGCTMADVVKNTIWLEDTRDFAGFNKAYGEFFPEDPPARATVRSDLMLDAKIEIETLAYKPLGD
ncbi:MAG: RidA family protein [Pseudomonadota bacterium]|nr:RidA family protein [Pseudomonadota bacterium]